MRPTLYLLHHSRLLSWYAGIKRSHRLPSQGCTADHPSIRSFGRSKRRWFEPMYESPHCHGKQWFIFSCSFFEFLQRNCGVLLRMDRPTTLKCNSRYMTSFAEETGDHLPRSAFCTNNFRCIWLVFEDPHGGLLLCFGLIRIDPWFVSCDDLLNVFWSTAIVFLQHLYAPIDKARNLSSNPRREKFPNHPSYSIHSWYGLCHSQIPTYKYRLNIENKVFTLQRLKGHLVYTALSN